MTLIDLTNVRVDAVPDPHAAVDPRGAVDPPAALDADAAFCADGVCHVGPLPETSQDGARG